MNMMQSIFAIAVVAGVPLAAAWADLPTADRKPIVEIVEQLEQQGYGPFSEISFDDGAWEVEVYSQNVPWELTVDVRTGEILSQHHDDADARPARDVKPLSQILRGLIEAGYTNIGEVSFERRYWEFELRRNDGKHEIHVAPTTGKVISDRLDD